MALDNQFARPLRPFSTVREVTIYVARWPLRHVYGGQWLKDHFERMLSDVGARALSQIYGLEFRSDPSTPKIRDLYLVSLMQGLILLMLVALSWLAWKATSDYVLPAFIFFSVFHVIPSDRDFLTSGDLADRVPKWLIPLTSALSFIVSLPAMIVALPAAIVWGLLGWVKLNAVGQDTR